MVKKYTSRFRFRFKFQFTLLILSSFFISTLVPPQSANLIESLPTSWIELQKIDDKFVNYIICDEYFDPEADEMSSFMISSKAELMQEEELEDDQFFVAFSEGFRVWLNSSEKSKETEETIIHTSGQPIIFRWIVKDKLAHWNFQGLDYEGFYTPIEHLGEYETMEEEC